VSLHEPHHDGSARYVSESAPALGSTVTVRVRVPNASSAERVYVRTTPDAEPRYVRATVDSADDRETWWIADVGMENPVVRYRFLLEGGASPSRWLNAAGTFHHDVTDAADFWLTTAAAPPMWLEGAVAYQIFPDRFSRSGASHHWPEWAVHSEWTEPIAEEWRVSTRQLFGGDLCGITSRLQHLVDLGVDAIYLTPFFPGHSAHRYDASTFDHVDPLLGGDDALIELTAAAHAVGIRVVGDLTTNHTGNTHEWFRTAQRDRSSTEAEFYFFDGPGADDYVGWYGLKSMPKLDHRAESLASRMLAGADSVTGKWLLPPFDLDGWRIDVANMTGRHGVIDTNHSVASTLRATIAEVRPDAWLVAEHCYDASADLSGDGWHGTMNYSGFTRPVWSWLRAADHEIGLMGHPSAPPLLDGAAMVATMQAYVAAMPWRSTTASMTLLGSHDTARWRTVAGDGARQLAGVGLLVTYPGVPTVYYGDEIGLQGENSDVGRTPMPWDDTTWDREVLAGYRELIALRRTCAALQRGGLRWVHVGVDTVAYLRESADDTVLVQVSRAAHTPVALSAGALGLGTAHTLYGRHQLTVVDGNVTLADEGPAVHIWRLEP
jgi:alpha-glucosidase